MSKIKEKIHEKLQERALNKAIINLIGYMGDYYISNRDRELQFNMEEEKLSLFDELNFTLPSWKEIAKQAKIIYKNFDDTVATKVVYKFSLIMIEKKLVVSAKDSDILLKNNNFTNVDIKCAENVEIYRGNLLNGGVDINAKNVKFRNSWDILEKDNINIIADTIEFHKSDITLENLNIKCNLLKFNNTNISCFKEMCLDTNLIISEGSKLKAENKIIINNTNCDEIKNVLAPTIIYNGNDITYSEGIVMTKLKESLIVVLSKIRNKVNDAVEKQVKEETEKYKKDLVNRQITKILKK